jgi:hypothetical protein
VTRAKDLAAARPVTSGAGSGWHRACILSLSKDPAVFMDHEPALRAGASLERRGPARHL